MHSEINTFRINPRCIFETHGVLREEIKTCMDTHGNNIMALLGHVSKYEVLRKRTLRIDREIIEKLTLENHTLVKEYFYCIFTIINCNGEEDLLKMISDIEDKIDFINIYTLNLLLSKTTTLQLCRKILNRRNLNVVNKNTVTLNTVLAKTTTGDEAKDVLNWTELKGIKINDVTQSIIEKRYKSDHHKKEILLGDELKSIEWRTTTHNKSLSTSKKIGVGKEYIDIINDYLNNTTTSKLQKRIISLIQSNGGESLPIGKVNKLLGILININPIYGDVFPFDNSDHRNRVIKIAEKLKNRQGDLTRDMDLQALKISRVLNHNLSELGGIPINSTTRRALGLKR